MEPAGKSNTTTQVLNLPAVCWTWRYKIRQMLRY